MHEGGGMALHLGVAVQENQQKHKTKAETKPLRERIHIRIGWRWISSGNRIGLPTEPCSFALRIVANDSAIVISPAAAGSYILALHAPKTPGLKSWDFASVGLIIIRKQAHFWAQLMCIYDYLPLRGVWAIESLNGSFDILARCMVVRTCDWLVSGACAPASLSLPWTWLTTRVCGWREMGCDTNGLWGLAPTGTVLDTASKRLSSDLRQTYFITASFIILP